MCVCMFTYVRCEHVEVHACGDPRIILGIIFNSSSTSSSEVGSLNHIQGSAIWSAWLVSSLWESHLCLRRLELQLRCYTYWVSLGFMESETLFLILQWQGLNQWAIPLASISCF